MSALIHKKTNTVAKKYDSISSSGNTISPKNNLLSSKYYKSRHRNASLTAEAAIVFPIFFFFFYLLWQYFLLLLLQLSICKDVTAIALQYGTLGYIERKAEGESAEALSWAFLPLLWTMVEKQERARNEFVFCTVEEDGTVKAEVRYSFLCEAPLLPEIKIPVTQKFSFFPYLGTYDRDCYAEDGEAGASGDAVYMTENGKVYHESASCTYLQMAIKAVAVDVVGAERNASGAKYTECEYCSDWTHTETVYITENGTKYHWGLKCSAISRNVYTKERREVWYLRACSKCGQKNKSEEKK